MRWSNVLLIVGLVAVTVPTFYLVILLFTGEEMPGWTHYVAVVGMFSLLFSTVLDDQGGGTASGK